MRETMKSIATASMAPCGARARWATITAAANGANASKWFWCAWTARLRQPSSRDSHSRGERLL
jgi:hypothetical protein